MGLGELWTFVLGVWSNIRHQVQGNISRGLISSIYKDGKKVLEELPRLATAFTARFKSARTCWIKYLPALWHAKPESLQPMLHINWRKTPVWRSAMAATPRDFDRWRRACTWSDWSHSI